MKLQELNNTGFNFHPFNVGFKIFRLGLIGTRGIRENVFCKVVSYSVRAVGLDCAVISEQAGAN